MPVQVAPELITNANWILITHAHLDHCDLDTLIPMSISSPDCKFLAPENVLLKLELAGIAKHRLIRASTKQPINISNELNIYTVPAAHPDIELDELGEPICVGFVIEYMGREIYHAGDTKIVDEVVESLNKFKNIQVGLLPINECSYCKDRLNIVGNMSLRDAFWLGEHLKLNVLVPIHWDMFEINSVFHEEVLLLFKLLKPNFEIKIHPKKIWLM